MEQTERPTGFLFSGHVAKFGYKTTQRPPPLATARSARSQRFGYARRLPPKAEAKQVAKLLAGVAKDRVFELWQRAIGAPSGLIAIMMFVGRVQRLCLAYPALLNPQVMFHCIPLSELRARMVCNSVPKANVRAVQVAKSQRPVAKAWLQATSSPSLSSQG